MKNQGSKLAEKRTVADYREELREKADSVARTRKEAVRKIENEIRGNVRAAENAHSREK